MKGELVGREPFHGVEFEVFRFKGKKARARLLRAAEELRALAKESQRRLARAYDQVRKLMAEAGLEAPPLPPHTRLMVDSPRGLLGVEVPGPTWTARLADEGVQVTEGRPAPTAEPRRRRAAYRAAQTTKGTAAGPAPCSCPADAKPTRNGAAAHRNGTAS